MLGARLWLQLQLELRDDTEVVASSSDRPKEVSVLVFVYGQDRAVGGNQSGLYFC